MSRQAARDNSIGNGIVQLAPSAVDLGPLGLRENIRFRVHAVMLTSAREMLSVVDSRRIPIEVELVERNLIQRFRLVRLGGGW